MVWEGLYLQAVRRRESGGYSMAQTPDGVIGQFGHPYLNATIGSTAIPPWKKWGGESVPAPTCYRRNGGVISPAAFQGDCEAGSAARNGQRSRLDTGSRRSVRNGDV